MFTNFELNENDRAYELVRKQPVKNGLQASAWFDALTFRRVHPAID